MRENGQLGEKIGGIIYIQYRWFKVLIINKPSVEYKILYLNKIVIKIEKHWVNKAKRSG